MAVKDNGGLVTWGDESQAASSVLPRVPDVQRLLEDLGRAGLWEWIGIQYHSIRSNLLTTSRIFFLYPNVACAGPKHYKGGRRFIFEKRAPCLCKSMH